MGESVYRNARTGGGRLPHHYGSRFHLLADPWSLSLMARLSHPDTQGLLFHQLLESAYTRLIRTAMEGLPTRVAHEPTRMTLQHSGTGYDGLVVDANARVVIADIARAGMVPSHICQRELLALLRPSGVRVDHLYLQRVTGPDGHVTGVKSSGSKIGGPADDATLILPDPMGATGGSILQALSVYDGLPGGGPDHVIALHLIVTPEYLRRVLTARPEVTVYALRVDRGLSSPDVLASELGERWDEERGLDAHDYIVPGAGGLGELINNAFV